MSSKTRKFIGPMSLVAMFAVIGALAAFVVLGLPNANPSEAQGFPPTAPTRAQISASDSSITVSWRPVSDIGSSALTSFTVQYREVGASDWIDVAALATDSSSTITGLENETTYEAQVFASNTDGDGPATYAGTATPEPNTLPSTPVVTITQGDLKADVDSVTTGDQPGRDVTISWKVADTGGAAISAYGGSYTLTTPDGTVGTAVPITGTATEVVLADQLLDTTIEATVTATNVVGESEAGAAADTVLAPGISTFTFRGTIASDSTSGGVAPQFTVTIPVLATDLPVGSSIVLYLEDDFNEPASIPASSVYFVADSPVSEQTGNGARVYATRAATIETDDYFNPTKNDISIRVFIPDMCTTDTLACQSANGPADGQRLQMVIEDTSGILNPTEEGNHSADFRVLGPTDSVPLIGPAGGDPEHTGINLLPTVAKIKLSDNNNTRGYEMTVTASGFNDGTSAGAYVLVQQAGEPTCENVILNGVSVGGATVGSDDVASIVFEVTSPTFKPGDVNYVCVSDGEGRRADDDVERFELEDSIRVVPSTVNAGDTVTVFAEDFLPGLIFDRLEVSGAVITAAFPTIGGDGSSTSTFVMPGSIDGNPVVGIRSVKAYFGGANAATKITVSPAELAASVTEVLPNDTITITGNGYGRQSCIPIANITLDNVQIEVDDDSQVRCDPDGSGTTGGPLPETDAVEVSNSGQFVATVTLWPFDSNLNDNIRPDNPTLISGTHTLNVEDSQGFTGSTTLTIAEPTISVTPGVVGPRDYIVISGTNWPVDNTDNSNAGLVEVVIQDDPRSDRVYSVYTDGTGRFTVEHRVSRDVAIPSTIQVTGRYDDTDVVKVGSFAVPSATITVDPAEAQPGDLITLSATDMKPYTSADEVKIGGSEVNFDPANTDIDGNITLSGLLVPGLDPGVYSVVLKVDETVAIGEINVLAEDSAAGAGAELPDALMDLGDSLVRVFHFNGVDKSWDFYDPRADFADLNTLTTMVNGEPYWILVSEGQENVVLNNRARTLTCVGGDCWNQIVW